MAKKLRTMRILIGLGVFLCIAAPTPAFAHDNLGGDELAVANWMLVAAIVTVALGVLWGVWAMNSGQFSNVESSKYSMLETAEDYDAIMAEADEREKAARAAAVEKQSETARKGTGAPETAVPAPGQKTVHI